ncbi:MAG: alpha/beta hydrolase [Candidatus Pacebacteria bacterium]|nr:alpha/beta hydrolase [Candidatus Paceibacterota bacterium]
MYTHKKRILFLLIHGMLVGPWCWNFLSKKLSEKSYNVVALALKGHGEEREEFASRLGTFGISDYVDDLKRKIDVIKKQYPKHQIILVGHSMGGLLTQILISKDPKAYHAGILITPAAPAGILSFEPSILRSFSPHFFKWNFWNKTILFSRKKAVYALLDGLDEEVQERFLANMQEESGRAAAEIGFWFVKALLHPFNKNACVTKVDYEKVIHPLLFIGAEHDRITPERIVRKNAGKYQNARYVKLSDKPHFILEEKLLFEMIMLFASLNNQTLK